jgi:hypothetical protein
LQQFRPRLAAELAVRSVEPADEAGHGRRTPPRDAFARQLAPRVEVHVARSFGGRLFPKIKKARTPVRHAHKHVAPAAEAAHRGVRNAQRKSHRNGGVHRVSPGLEDRDSDIGGIDLAANHHRPPGPLGLGRPGRDSRNQKRRSAKLQKSGHAQ